MEDVVVSRPFIGICHMQVCALKTVSDEEVAKAANALNPSGVSNGWEVVRDDENLKPVQCTDYPDRQHIILVC